MGDIDSLGFVWYILCQRVPVEHCGIVGAYVIDTSVGLVYSNMTRNNSVKWILFIDGQWLRLLVMIIWVDLRLDVSWSQYACDV